MILLSRIKYLTYAIAIGPAFIGYPLNAVTIADIMAIIKNNMTDRKLISSSSIPNLVLGALLFIAILVSFPVSITNPYILPLANTVLAHMICSNVNGSFDEFPLTNNPAN